MTSTDMASAEQWTNWTLQAAIEQLKSCDYECEGGHLANNVAWIWLTKSPRPNYFVGQSVWTEVEGELAGHRVKRWQRHTVVACYLSADNVRQVFKYDLSNDPIQPYHYGTGAQLQNISESKLSPVSGEGQ